MEITKKVTEESLKALAEIIIEKLAEKQDIVEDLDVIRASAILGATSLQKHQDISGKADVATTLAGYGIEDAYTKAEIDSIVSSVYTYQGSVENVSDLPVEDNRKGDVWEVLADNVSYSWNGEKWGPLGGLVDLSSKADVGTSLADYGITDAYTKDELASIINNNNPIIEDQKSYIIKGDTAFYNYKQTTVSLYLMERQNEGFHALNPLGGSGLFVVNNSDEDFTMIVSIRNYANYTTGSYKYGYANKDASPSDINYNLEGSNMVQSGSGTVKGENVIVPVTVPAGKKGFLLNSSWDASSETNGPLEITECYINEVFEVNDTFQGMTIKTEALMPTPVILTREEFDAIEPKKNTCMYYIIEE